MPGSCRGGGSIARWLADRVGPGGRVVATDINVGHLRTLSLPNLDVLRHNIIEDDLREPASVAIKRGGTRFESTVAHQIIEFRIDRSRRS
jgi:hypothetical protein